MVATEIFLIAAGVICVVVSVVMSFGDDKENVESSAKAELTQAQLDMVKHQVDEVIKQQISGLSEKTEAALDKISNTKILEMNEYADNVLKEINRNHNEVMFMYDMLNEKDKEIKTTVKSVNATNTQARGMGTVRERLIKLDETQKAPQRISVDEFPLDDKLDKNQKIMTLYNNGYNDIDIAKRLKFGVGEVRLVIKLYVNAAGE